MNCIFTQRLKRRAREELMFLLNVGDVSGWCRYGSRYVRGLCRELDLRILIRRYIQGKLQNHSYADVAVCNIASRRAAILKRCRPSAIADTSFFRLEDIEAPRSLHGHGLLHVFLEDSSIRIDECEHLFTLGVKDIFFLFGAEVCIGEETKVHGARSSVWTSQKNCIPLVARDDVGEQPSGYEFPVQDFVSRGMHRFLFNLIIKKISIRHWVV